MANNNWGFTSNNSASNNIKSASAPKVKHDFKASKPSSTKPERQKTIKTNASLVDKLGALQMALGYKNRTETFQHLLRAGATQLMKGKPSIIKRYHDAYKLIHN